MHAQAHEQTHKRDTLIQDCCACRALRFLPKRFLPSYTKESGFCANRIHEMTGEFFPPCLGGQKGRKVANVLAQGGEASWWHVYTSREQVP